MYSPTLGVATLAAYAEKRAPQRRVEQAYAYLRWLALLRERFGDEALAIYRYIAEVGAYSGIGDLVFADALGSSASSFVPSDSSTAAARYVDAAWTELVLCAEELVQQEAARLLALADDQCVLGISSTFTQTFPGLAIARRFAAERPDVPIVLGGANFGPEKAEIYFREFPFVAAVAFGEGESALHSLLVDLDHGDEMRACSGLVVRRPDGAAYPDGDDHPDLFPMDELASPSVRAYFDQLTEAGLDDEFQPKLSWELARGCWWGERRHCTFCGLNGNAMTFRRRHDHDTAAAIMEQVREHRTLDVIVVDNILDPDDIERVFERLPTHVDLQIHIEVKADLSLDQLRRLRDHGVWHVQPGVESMARKPLQLMRKGVTPWMNVRFLRDAESLGLTVAWNILVGFPGEDDSDYAEMLANLPKLFHLQPPALPTRIALVRHSPLFADPEIRVAGQRPARFNRFLWPTLSESELEEVSDVFSAAAPIGATAALTEQITQVVEAWKSAYPTTSLLAETTDEGVVVTRSDAATGESLTVAEVATGGWRFRLWELLGNGLSRDGLRRFLAAEPVGERQVLDWVDELLHQGVLLADGGVLLALPVAHVDHVPVKLP